jgi:hypothetical protein
VLACFDTHSTWNLHVNEKLYRDLPIFFKEGIPAFRPGGNPTTAELTTL